MTWRPAVGSRSAIDEVMRRDLITRRTFMRRAGRGSIALGALATLPGLLAACGPSSSGAQAALAQLDRLHRHRRGERSRSDAVPLHQCLHQADRHRRRVQRGSPRQRRVPGAVLAGPARRQLHRLGRHEPGGWVVERMARNDYLVELDHSKLPNWTANCADYAKGLWFDPDNKHSVWWQGGITGIGYDPELTGREITSFEDLLDPAFSGRVGGFSRHARHVRPDPALARRRAGERDRRRRAARAAEAAGTAARAFPRLLRQRVLRRARRRRPRHLRWRGPGDVSQIAPLRQPEGQVRGARRGRHALERQPGHPEGRRRTSTTRSSCSTTGTTRWPPPRSRSTSATSPRSRAWTTASEPTPRLRGPTATRRRRTYYDVLAPQVLPSPDQLDQHLPGQAAGRGRGDGSGTPSSRPSSAPRSSARRHRMRR